ncbi:calcium-translocating P-type ATPase, PMCA-type [Proteiniphilum sp.]|uniref:calcium-translocating P-type ATPase, PMCA-type n=1 Tax=Proteiniphilum sp. TaxID=1926877 RepID=UPI002B2209F5|nr:calcium-translocating P-type ATPase, PMCA-type [Proteiniphilum sp.]MEA4917715.1 calcium-translocating P-type ATPase, PMCA-type [Proteiniphilum sp.]
MKDHYYNQPVKEVLQQLEVSSSTGLSDNEVKERLNHYGPNQLESRKQKSLLAMFFEQFKSMMVVILLAAAILSGVVGVMEGEGLIESFVILAILLVNAIIGMVQEKKAQSSLEALNRMSSPHSKVLRGGQVTEITSTEIVPGDIVILDTGDIIPADLRLIEAVNMQVQEAALTGESVPVEKNHHALEAKELPLGDRDNMAFSTSTVTYGRGKGVVVGTGMQTEVGKIAHMLQNTQQTETPMNKRLGQLGKVLGYVALGICVFIFIIGVLYGNDWLEMLMMAVSLAVAAIPEGLQIVSTIVLAIGVQRLVKLNAIVRTLPSVETLGSTTVICSDKTGTLTQNKMTVVEGWAGGNRIDFRNPPLPEELDSDERMLLQSSLLCTDAHLKKLPDGKHETAGDPTEIAIVDVALSLKMDKNELENRFTRENEVPFDSERKRMSTINRMEEGQLRVNLKGGLDEVLSITTHILIHGKVRPITEEDKETIREENHRMAQSALRVLAIAYKDMDALPAEVKVETVENGLIFIGLLGMIDPARPEALEAVKKCRTAGIRPVMITGDHKVTAVAIADEIGIYHQGDKAITGPYLEEMDDEALYNDVESYSVYARVAPEHKVRIVKAWQSHGDIVAMTGDGVNDAPALKQADIGVSMGIVGTEVAKEASDVILTDDNFATIVKAVEEGRRIYDNILKVIQFLLSANVGEVLLIFIASIVNIGNPLTPILILWINLVTDSLPALALSMDPANRDIMTRKPRDPKKGFFTRGMIWRIGYQGATIGLISLAAYIIGFKDGGQPLGQTMAFAVLGFSQLLHVRNLHSNIDSSFRTSLFSNMALLGAIFASALLLVVVLLIPGLMDIFGVTAMDSTHWMYVGILSLVPIVVVELVKLMKLNHSKDDY